MHSGRELNHIIFAFPITVPIAFKILSYLKVPTFKGTKFKIREVVICCSLDHMSPKGPCVKSLVFSFTCLEGGENLYLARGFGSLRVCPLRGL